MKRHGPLNTGYKIQTSIQRSCLKIHTTGLLPIRSNETPPQGYLDVVIHLSMMAMSPSAPMRVLLDAAVGRVDAQLIKSHRLHAFLLRFFTSTSYFLLWFHFAAIGSHGIELI